MPLLEAVASPGSLADWAAHEQLVNFALSFPQLQRNIWVGVPARAVGRENKYRITPRNLCLSLDVDKLLRCHSHFNSNSFHPCKISHIMLTPDFHNEKRLPRRSVDSSPPPSKVHLLFTACIAKVPKQKPKLFARCFLQISGLNLRNVTTY